MSIKIYKGKYKNVFSIIIESKVLRVNILPQYGAKIQSIFQKEKQKEYLFQSEGKYFKKPEYGIFFEKGECSGFDDMFPSISTCYYPVKPWQGIKVPDHGEVWSIPWDYELKDDSIILSTHGVRFPYKLIKKISLKNNNILNIEYKAINYSNYNFDFIWAAHPLFNCSENTKIILPESVDKVINVYNESKRLGKYGKVFSWPIANTGLDNEYDMSKISSKKRNLCEKYYILNDLDLGKASLYDTKTGDLITLRYPIDKVPYLGVWINEGGFLGQYNVALEPCTGAFDRVDFAKQWNRISTIEAKNKYEWFLEMKFANKTLFK